MTNSKNKNVAVAGFLIAFLGSILFSTKAVIVKKAFADIKADALTLLAVRMLFSLPFFLAAAWIASSKKENVRFTRKQWIYVLLIGLLGYYVSSLLDFIGLKYISAGLERLILFLYPSFTIFINMILFREKISTVQKSALALTYSGILIAYIGEMHIDGGNPNFIWGSMLIFLCAITYASYIVGSGKLIPIVGPNKFNAYAMLAATVGILLHFLLCGNIGTLTHFKDYWGYGLLLAVVATVTPSFLISNALQRIGSNNVAIVSSIGPVSTIIQAHFILGEPIFPAQIFGTILVVIGVTLIGWKRREAG